MKLKELLYGVDITAVCADPEIEIVDVCCDSRKAKAGTLFTAITGYKTDGNEYVESARENGAVCILCEKAPQIDVPYVLTNDVRKAFALICANYFENPAKKLKIIGVTGTNGKTTVTHLIKNIIENTTNKRTGLIGTINDIIGDNSIESENTTPDAYTLHRLFDMMVRAGCKYAVMEVSSHALFQHRTYGIEFDVGVFTNLTQDHLDFHKTMEAYGDAKAMLFANSKVSVINIDDKSAGKMIAASKKGVYTYSVEKNDADLIAKNVTLKHDGVSFCSLCLGKLEKVKLGLPGLFSVYNALAAIAAAVNLGIDLEEACCAVSSESDVKGRAELVPTGKDFSVMIDYAHTPDALENILKMVRQYADGRIITVFGCGGDRDNTKREPMGKIAAVLSDEIVVTSDNPRTEDPMKIICDIMKGVKGSKTPYSIIENRREAIRFALNNAKKNDIIILAGKGHEDYQIIGKEKSHFDEREEVFKIISEMDKN